MYFVLSLDKGTFLLIVSVLLSVLYDTLSLLFSRTYDSFCIVLTLSTPASTPFL
jgi:hypothetical protein